METNFRLKIEWFWFGLAGEDISQWFIVVNSVLSDSSGRINAVCSGPLDTLQVVANMDQLIAKTRLEKLSSTMMPPPMNKKVKVNIFVKILEKKTQLAHVLIKLLKMLITKKRLPTTNLCQSFEQKNQKKWKNTKNTWMAKLYFIKMNHRHSTNPYLHQDLPHPRLERHHHFCQSVKKWTF